MLVHPRFPGFSSPPHVEDPDASGRPARTVIGDALKRFWRATKPPARVGVGMGASVLQRLVRGVLAVNMYVVASTAIAGLWTLGKLRTFVPLAVLTVFM